jgi:cysteinyl-tRNA synthetase
MDQLMLGNLLEKYSAELLRFVVLSTHYRRPIEFSDEEIAAKKKGLDSFHRLFERIERVTGQDPFAGGPTIEQLGTEGQAAGDAGTEALKTACADFQERFAEAMDDDFNTGAAIGVLFEITPAINRFIDEHQLEAGGNGELKPVAMAAVQSLRKMAGLLGLFEQRPPAVPKAADDLVDSLMNVLINVRAEARKAKQYALSDLIRDQLSGLGIVLEDRPGGTIWRKSE